MGLLFTFASNSSVAQHAQIVHIHYASLKRTKIQDTGQEHHPVRRMSPQYFTSARAAWVGGKGGGWVGMGIDAKTDRTT
jgi:hypothetical protein